MKNTLLFFGLLLLFSSETANAQQSPDSNKIIQPHKNVIRYNLSSGLLFGIDKYIVFGYERVISPHQSFSINVGRASLPKLVSISTDSFNAEKNLKRSGFNLSVDYRFYLGKENKYNAPRGVYIGPYYSYNHFTSETQWTYVNQSTNQYANTNSDFTINSFGIEMGYQFILWKRLALDMVLVGPGLGFYNYKATIDSNVDETTKEQLYNALEQLLTQKYPGLNYVFSNHQLNGDGVLKTSNIGYRYIIHVGFNF